MKQYVVDELRPGDHDLLKKFLDKNLEPSGMADVYWKAVDENLLTPKQSSHTKCAPFFFALVLSRESLSCELLVRTKARVRCDCMAYATVSQRNWIIQWLDDVLGKLDVLI